MYKPALGVRIYHKQEDFIKIPALIDSISNNEYKFFLRYDCHFRGAADLTLYAV